MNFQKEEIATNNGLKLANHFRIILAIILLTDGLILFLIVEDTLIAVMKR